MSDKFNVMATIRRQEISGFDDNGQPIYEEKHYDQIFMEGFKSEAEAAPYAASTSKDPHVVMAWVQPASMPFVDPDKKAQAIKHKQTRTMVVER